MTPGHDHTDFEVARRHNLDIISVINESGFLSETVCDYAVSKFFFSLYTPDSHEHPLTQK